PSSEAIPAPVAPALPRRRSPSRRASPRPKPGRRSRRSSSAGPPTSRRSRSRSGPGSRRPGARPSKPGASCAKRAPEMLFSRALIPTTKEAPADATNASHVLLSRAGFIRRVGAGIYDFLPLGYRVLRKIQAVVREEMDRAGALEVLMPALLPAEYFKETGRWELYGDVLFRLRDRKGGDYHLGPTHEEIVTDIARREIKSWRDLPKTLYQVQVKFRDEPRPRGGLLRGREFVMKDAYSFDADEKGAAESYERMRQAYVRIFDRLGLTYRMVQADSGAIGGSTTASA